MLLYNLYPYARKIYSFINFSKLRQKEASVAVAQLCISKAFIIAERVYECEHGSACICQPMKNSLRLHTLTVHTTTTSSRPHQSVNLTLIDNYIYSKHFYYHPTSINQRQAALTTWEYSVTIYRRPYTLPQIGASREPLDSQRLNHI